MQIILSVGKLYCHRYVIGPNSYMLQICDRYLSYNCDRYLPQNCDRYLSQLCDRYLSHNCDRYVMGPNSYMLQICDRYFRTYIFQIFYRTVTYICHISVSLVRDASTKPSWLVYKNQKNRGLIHPSLIILYYTYLVSYLQLKLSLKVSKLLRCGF
jgi:hypothetical protein